VRYVTSHQQEIRAEYLLGKQETTPDRALYLRGNRVSGWYVAARQPLSRRDDVVLKYDEYSPLAGGNLAGGVNFTRRTLIAAFVRQVSGGTLLRFTYQKGLTPYDPSAPSGSPLRANMGAFLTELQVSF
jgi:hypothetical protein